MDPTHLAFEEFSWGRSRTTQPIVVVAVARLVVAVGDAHVVPIVVERAAAQKPFPRPAPTLRR